MDNIQATITNIRAQLTARGWTITESLDGESTNTQGEVNICHLEAIDNDGKRLGWGYMTRVGAWTELYLSLIHI